MRCSNITTGDFGEATCGRARAGTALQSCCSTEGIDRRTGKKDNATRRSVGSSSKSRSRVTRDDREIATIAAVLSARTVSASPQSHGNRTTITTRVISSSRQAAGSCREGKRPTGTSSARRVSASYIATGPECDDERPAHPRSGSAYRCCS